LDPESFTEVVEARTMVSARARPLATSPKLKWKSQRVPRCRVPCSTGGAPYGRRRGRFRPGLSCEYDD
jgi:hypothetical protein